MFIKLIVLILVCGSSGIGLLSVRQSRLQAAHEMAKARHQCRTLDEQAGEVRAQIVEAYTPERVAALLGSLDGYRPVIHHQAPISDTQGISEPSMTQALIVQPVDQPVDQAIVDAPLDQNQVILGVPAEHRVNDERIWILDDGTRVIFVD